MARVIIISRMVCRMFGNPLRGEIRAFIPGAPLNLDSVIHASE